MKTNRFKLPTTVFSLVSILLLGACFLLRSNKTYPNVNVLLYILTLYSFVMLFFYDMNIFIIWIKKICNIPYKKVVEIQKPIKKTKKKKTSYKNIKIEVEQYSLIPSLLLLVISTILMFFTFELGVKNEKTGLFYFVNIPIFITGVSTLLLTLASNLRLKWLKMIYLMFTFVSIFLGFICLVTI